jgi:hypothetical protein
LALVVTERAFGGGARSMVTLTGTEAEIADSLANGTGLSAQKYRWNGDLNRIVGEGCGIVGAVSITYVAPVKFG